VTDTTGEPGGSPPFELDARVQDAARLTEEERWGEAFELLQEMEADYPDDAMLLAMLGTVASEMEARAMAYDYFRRGLGAQPTDPAVLVLLGAGLARFDDPDAEGVLRLASITAPHLPSTRFQYGSYLAREGLHDLALRELTAARDLDPEDPLVLRELGVAQWLAGATQDSAASLEAAAELAPDDLDARLLAGLVRILSGDSEEGAEEVVRTAAELVHDGDVQIVASLSAAAEGWLDEAWNALARAEGAVVPADDELVRETEEALELGEDGARRLLLDEVLPRIFRERLLERP
jgi:Flp pilus assembly protein TadD